MKTIIEKLQAKADVIAHRYHDDVDYISIYASDDQECDYYGVIVAEFYEFGGPKWKDGKIIGDHSCFSAVREFEEFVKTLGAKIEYAYNVDGDGHHGEGYQLIWTR